jgi:hypothetical protein
MIHRLLRALLRWPARDRTMRDWQRFVTGSEKGTTTWR